MDFCKAIADRVKSLMKEFNLTKKELAEKANIPREYLDIILSGKHNDISIKALYNISKALDITIIDFFNVKVFIKNNFE